MQALQQAYAELRRLGVRVAGVSTDTWASNADFGTRYDDGGLSGGTLERAALQQLARGRRFGSSGVRQGNRPEFKTASQASPTAGDTMPS